MPAVSSDPPENRPGKPIVFIRSCFGWGLHGFPRYRRNGSLLHCLSTLTRLHTTVCWRFISVALALESPPPDVIRHPALRSPDFPHPHKWPRLFILLILFLFCLKGADFLLQIFHIVLKDICIAFQHACMNQHTLCSVVYHCCRCRRFLNNC